MSDSVKASTMSAPQADPLTSPSIWRNRDFVWLFFGRTLSQFGTAVTAFAIPWLLLQLTGSAAQTGIAFAVGFVPYLLLSLPAGVWADRYNRKTLMIVADGGRLLLLLSIPLAHVLVGHIPILLLYAVQAGVSLFAALFDAAYGACLPNLVERSQLREGNAALQTGFSISRIGGPVLAGVLVAVLGAAHTLLVDVSSYIISILTLLLIRAPFSVERSTTARRSMRDDVREGIHHVWKMEPIRMLALLTMLVNLVGPGMDIALLYRANHELLLPSGWSGMIMAGLSGGMLVGSLLIGRAARRFRPGAMLLVSTTGLVVPPLLLTVSDTPVVMLLVQVLVGLLLIAWNVQSTTLRQSLVPDHLLGRCVSIFRLIAWITIPLGCAAAGAISEAWGARAFFLIAGGVHAGVCLLSVTLVLRKKL
jgi:MFS family permease